MTSQDADDANPFAAPECEVDVFDSEVRNDSLIYAGFGTRFVAAILDTILVNVISTALVYFYVFISNYPFNSLTRDPIRLVALLLGWLYSASMESSSAQATLGKRAMGVKVVDMNGNRISFLRASGRHFGKLVSTILIFTGYLMQPFTAKRQTLHDIMAGCLVIQPLPNWR